MKTIMSIVAVMLLVVAGCNDGQMTTWGLTAPDSDANFRVGLTVGEAQNAEIAFEVGYDSSSLNNDGTPDRLGGVFIYHLTQELRWDDTPDPSPFKDLLDTLQARPYVGVGIMVDRGDQRLEGKWIAGSTFADHPDRPWAFVAEWQSGDGLVTAYDDEAVFFGVRLEF